MNLNTGYFPPHGYRRKQIPGSYHLSLNNQQHHHSSSTLPSARSSNEGSNTTDLVLPSLSTSINYNNTHRPYRQNDFANNHLFLAKRKLASIFLGQPTKSLQSRSDLIHLFDHQEPKRKPQFSNKPKRQVKVFFLK